MTSRATLYVVNEKHNVVKFNSSEVKEADGELEAEGEAPVAIAVDQENGEVFVLDSEGRQFVGGLLLVRRLVPALTWKGTIVKKLLVSTLVAASLATPRPLIRATMTACSLAASSLAGLSPPLRQPPPTIRTSSTSKARRASSTSAPRRASSMPPPRDMRQRRARLRLSRRPPTIAALLGPTSIKEPLVTNDCQPMSVIRGGHGRAASRRSKQSGL